MIFATMLAQVDGQNGLTGWIAAVSTVGLLGPVLYWLCYHHLPAKDHQVKDLLDMAATEREKDRISRHEMAGDFTKAVASMYSAHAVETERVRQSGKEALDTICEEFRRDCEAERLACQKNFEAVAKSIEGLRKP